MTDRAQPGAIKSLARNDELAQVLGQLTGGFDDGWVADPADPTAVSTRRSDINESAFDGFALSGVSGSSLSVDVGPGEAFAGGWFARDTNTTVSLPANTTSTIVAAMDLDAVYDPDSDPDRDAADRVVIDLAANVSDDLPRVRLHEATTDGSGVTGATDLRTPYGPALEADSGTVGTLEATGSFTDPTGTSYTDLSLLGGNIKYVQGTEPSNPSADETWYDTDVGVIRVYADRGNGLDWQSSIPLRVTEEASTFTESDVTLSTNNTSVSGGSIQLFSSNGTFVDDWEDGDIAGWSGDTSNLTNQSGFVLTGNQTAELTANTDFIRVESPSVGGITDDFECIIYIDTKTGDGGERATHLNLFDSNDSLFGKVQFDGDGSSHWVGNSSQSIDYTWQEKSSFTLRLEWDFPSDQVDVIINGVNYGTYDFDQAVSNWDNIYWTIDYTTAYIDATVDSSAGDALIEWESGVPADLASYDLATFQRTLDSETVTIDVEDGNGNVLFSDISQNFDISTVDTSKNVKLRANLSRNDTANNPTLDYLARRFNR